MYMIEYGKEHSKRLLFFPGSCEPWQEFAYAAKELAKYFHVFMVVADGQDPEEGSEFSSVEKTVDDTASWLKEHNINHLEALYGLSYGGGMVTCFLTTKDITVDKAIIDAGTAPYSYPKWVCKIICFKDFLMMKIAIASTAVMKIAYPPERGARDINNADEEYNELKQYLKTYTNRTLWNIFWSANNYEVPNLPPHLDTEIQFWVGTDEWKSRLRDLKWYQKYLPQLELVKNHNMMHAEFVMMYPVEFAHKAAMFFDR